MTFRTVSATRSVAKPKRAILLVLAFVVALLVLPSVAAAATETWNGSTSADWNTAANWTPNTVPSASDSVIIDNGSATNQPECASATCSASTITVSSPASLTIDGGTLLLDALTVDNASDLILTSGTIGAGSSGTATLKATTPVVLTNAGVDYGASTSDTVALGLNVELDQTNPVDQQGTLAIGSHTFDLVSASIDAAGGNPTITIGTGGLFDNKGSGGATTDTVEPRIVMASTSTIADHSTASPEELVLANSAAGASASQYQGTINETGTSGLTSIVLGNDHGTSPNTDGGGSLTGALTIENTSHDRSNSENSRVVIFTSSATGGHFDLAGNTVTMNGDLTLDGTHGQTISGSGTFQTAPACLPANCVGDLLIHNGQFAGPAAQAITIPNGTTAVVENNGATWNQPFTFNVNGVLLLDGQDITTAAVPASAPVINIGSSGLMNHINAASTIQPIVTSSGTIEDSGQGMTLGNPNGVNPDTLAGTLVTEGQSCLPSSCVGNSISLGLSGSAFGTNFQLTGPLTSDNFTQHGTTASTAGTIGTAGNGPNLQLNSNTLTIAGDGSTNYEFTHAAGTISGTGTINGPGALRLAGGNLTPGSPMTFNETVDQFTGGVGSPTMITGSGGHLAVNGLWFTAADIDYSGTNGTDVAINGGLGYLGGGGDSVNVPLTVNGTLSAAGTGTWTIDSTNGGTLATRCPGPVHCTTTIASTAVVTVASGTLSITDLTNVGGNTPNNTLTAGTYTIGNGAVLQLPTASTHGVQHLDAALSITGSGQLEDASANVALAGLDSVDAGATLHFLGSYSATTALTTIDGTVILDGSSNLSNANGPLSGTTVTMSGLLEGNGGSVTGDLSNNGTVHPGDGPGSPGELSVHGRYSQGASGALDIDIDGTTSGQYSLLAVTNNLADLGGTLNVTPSTSYAATAATGDDIAFGLDSTGLTGQFATVNISPVLNSGKGITIDYAVPGEIKLLVGAGNGTAPMNSTPPVISGTPTQGDTLSTTNGTWVGGPTFTYQWADCNTSGTGCTNIAGATGNTYTLTAGDVGHTVVVTVTATNTGGSTPASSAPTATIAAAPVAKPANTSPPVISGSANRGQTLSTTNGTWTGSPTFAYQWYDCNSAGAGCTTIGGATGSTYTLANGDLGHTVVVVVTGTNAGGSVPAVSAATAVVKAVAIQTPKPHLSKVGLGSKSFKASSGTSLTLKMPTRAKIKVVITEIVSGRKANGVCKAKAKKGTKCTSKKQVRTLHFTGAAGSDRFSLKLKGLKKGSYSARLTATDSTGRTSNAVTIKFKLK